MSFPGSASRTRNAIAAGLLLAFSVGCGDEASAVADAGSQLRDVALEDVAIDDDAPPSADASSVPPPPPPTATPVGSRAVRVSWAADHGPSLELVRRPPAGDSVRLVPLESAIEILDYGLDPETTYAYRSCRTEPAGAAPICSSEVLVTTPRSELGTTLDVTTATSGVSGSDDLVLFSVLDLDNAATFGAVVLADRTGRVVWELVDTREGLISDVDLLDDGTLQINQFAEIRLLDLYQRPVRRFANRDPAAGRPSPRFADVTVPTDRDYHHDAHPFGSDAWLALVFLTRRDDTTGLDILGDGVSIFDAETGEERWLVDLFDLYDYRVVYSAHDIESTFLGRGHDWTHSNALWFDDARSELYVNVRNLDRIAVIAYPSGALVREIGDGGRTFAHTHDPEYLADGSILVFDNGLYRADGSAYSRAVQFEERAGALDVVWEYRESPDFYAPIFGDADRLESGNTLVAIGSSHPARIVEADAAREKVWEVALSRPELGIYNCQPVSLAAFRRLSGLR